MLKAPSLIGKWAGTTRGRVRSCELRLRGRGARVPARFSQCSAVLVWFSTDVKLNAGSGKRRSLTLQFASIPPSRFGGVRTGVFTADAGSCTPRPYPLPDTFSKDLWLPGKSLSVRGSKGSPQTVRIGLKSSPPLAHRMGLLLRGEAPFSNSHKMPYGRPVAHPFLTM